MLEQELLGISEEKPLSPARAAGLVGPWLEAREALSDGAWGREGLGGTAAAEGAGAGRPIGSGTCRGAKPSRSFSCAGGRVRGELVGAGRLEGPWVCAIGAFDGFHAGHQALIARARAEAREAGARVCAVTFSPDPAEVLGAPCAGSRLVEPALRPCFLLAGGADAVATFIFDRSFAGLTYEEFVRGALLELLDVRSVVVGADFRMGAGGSGTVDALRGLGRGLGFGVVGLELVDEGGRHVTATRVRGLVREGRVEAAAGLMGRCHSVRGRVVRGRGEGTGFGFPTANVVTDAMNCIPGQGVYACLVSMGRGDGAAAFPAAVNVGLPPSFEHALAAGDGGEALARGSLLEANLIGFSGDLYGSEICVTFLRWLRDSRRFDSLDELKATVLGNIAWVRDCLGASGIPLAGGGVPHGDDGAGRVKAGAPLSAAGISAPGRASAGAEGAEGGR